MSLSDKAGDEESQAKPEAIENSDATNQSLASTEILPPINADNELEGLRPNSLDGALFELFNSDSRRNPIVVMLSIASAWARDINLRNTALQDRNSRSIAENQRLSEVIAGVREENAALKAERAMAKRHGPLKAIALFSAPIIFALAIDEFRNESMGSGVILALIGIFMLIALWLTGVREGEGK